MKTKLNLYIFLIFIQVFLLCVSKPMKAQTPGWIWGKYLGHYISDLTSDASGNVYATGSFSGTIDFDPGPADFIANSGTNVLVSNIFVLKWDASGNFIWAKSIGSPNTDCKGVSIALDGSNNIYVTGLFMGDVDFDPNSGVSNLTGQGNGAQDIFILKLTNTGNFIWAKGYGSSDYDWVHGIEVDAAGNFFIYASPFISTDIDPGPGTYMVNSNYLSKFDSAGNFLFAKTFNAQDFNGALTKDSQGNILIMQRFSAVTDVDPSSAVYNLTPPGAMSDVFVCKLDALGNFIWAISFGGSGEDKGNDLVTDASGNVCITGDFTNTVDFNPGTSVNNLTSLGGKDIFILKLNSTGSFQWAKSIGYFTDESAESITLDPNGKPCILGDFESSGIDFDPSPTNNFNISTGPSAGMFVLKLNNSGDFIWAQTIAGDGIDDAFCIHADFAGNLLIAGWDGVNNLTFGSDVLTNPYQGAFLAKHNNVVGIEEIGEFNIINYYPNPASNKLNIALDRIYSKIEISIIDFMGKIVLVQNAINAPNVGINISNLENGIYILNVKTPNFSKSEKLVIEK